MEITAQNRGSSNRAFGLVFAAVFLLVTVYSLAKGRQPAWWAAALGGAFLLLAILRPGWLAPLNRAWMRLSLLLHRLVTPIALGLMFYVVVTPTGALRRLLGNDPLHLRRAPNSPTYWLEREASRRNDFRKQF